MAALLDFLDTTAEDGVESKTYLIPSLTASDLNFKKEIDEESEGSSKKTKSGYLGYLSLDLTYQELKSMAVRGSETSFYLPTVSTIRDESYGSTVTATAYIRQEAVAYLENVADLLKELKGSYDDKMSRQIIFFQIKDHLSKFWKIDLPKNDYFLQAVSLLEDSLAYIKSEDLSNDQVEGLLEVVEICKKIELSIDDARRCGKVLRNRKITTLPTLS
jgi:hypothetical protein